VRGVQANAGRNGTIPARPITTMCNMRESPPARAGKVRGNVSRSLAIVAQPTQGSEIGSNM
jgi:hypothetical protein